MADSALAQIEPLEAWWITTGEFDSTGLGATLAPIGDLNDDGFSDFIVGSSNAFYVYFGSSSMDTIPAFMLHSPNPVYQYFGWKIFAVGDLNGDGESPDMAIWVEIHYPQDGVYLYWGGAAFDSLPDLLIVGPDVASSNFGGSGIANIGDFNGDGWEDLAIGDGGYLDTIPPPNMGKVFVYYGGPEMDSNADWSYQSSDSYDRIGDCLTGIGDYNQDGFSDFVCGSPVATRPGLQDDLGLILLFQGSSSPDTIPDIQFWGAEPNHVIGRSLSAIDVNGDGRLDIATGGGWDSAGVVIIYYTYPCLDSLPDRIFSAGLLGSIGYNIVGMDLDGNGWQDIISGEPGNFFDCGLVAVFLNDSNADTILDTYYARGDYIGCLGTAIANAGDVNGDGLEDLIVGQPGYGGTALNGYGRVHLILGDTTLHQSVAVAPEPDIKDQKEVRISITVFPNPFNQQAIIQYSLDIPGESEIKVAIFNLGGRLIYETIAHGNEGYVKWNCQDHPSGIYIARLTSKIARLSKKIVLLR